MNTQHDTHHIISFPGSHGELGGKAERFLKAAELVAGPAENADRTDSIKIPRTWFVTSDYMQIFIKTNNLEYLLDQKYKTPERIRLEYPGVIRRFRESEFPAALKDDLSRVLDDLHEKPLIVRSSGILSNLPGKVFSGKYKSLFLTNQGTEKDRLRKLLDAIAQVYASMFSPESIHYRTVHGLLEYNEELGLMIQEVVGIHAGHYFFPAYAGVAFSRNDIRWSPRLSHDDGLMRLVPGLGTRAVNHFNDDYPILAAPGQPRLRVNASPDEIIHYSPQKIDVINLKTDSIETMEIQTFICENGHELPWIRHMVSVVHENHIRSPVGLLDFDSEHCIITFQSLLDSTPFAGHIHTLLKTLEEKTGEPVQIEFASDGTCIYLLQCRPQVLSEENTPPAIPQDIHRNDVIFTANRHVPNGTLPDISHIVYVDPEQYRLLREHQDFRNIAGIIGQLNHILPKRRFVLMGPGRWGSRGDVKLGVPVKFADLSRAAMLVEIALQTGNYLPELSFGTHFFHDLVESRIRYLPLYPSDDDVIFNERFLRSSKNILPELFPEFERFKATVHVIDIPSIQDGRLLKIVMNADLHEALAYITDPYRGDSEAVSSVDASAGFDESDHWKWRLHMAEKIAQQLDSERFGVHAVYVFGSTKNATAGPGSDIDLLIHIRGTREQLTALQLWLEGWSLSLSEMNYLRTGYRTEGLLDVHFVTDADIENRTSYASKIGAVTDPARELPFITSGK
ncbi:MAG TPA: PEP/pyruvate-binding domain-containing protein [bacterium]|nr:PEP/pyruvate-binding domain-containing protein [bacterium]